MRPPHLQLAILLAMLAVADRGQGAIVRGLDKDLEICLSGQVLDSDGQPAADVEIACGINGFGTITVEPVVDGHRFEVWIPVNAARWYSMWLKASTKRNDHVAYRQLGASEIRQAAIDRLELKLQQPTRHVKVKVTHDGQPVPGATVKADLGFGIELHARANGQGIAPVMLLPGQELSRLMAWTEDFRIGGFSFGRDPPRDPDANEHVVELSKCRNQTMRFVDESGMPVAGIPFVVQMATPPPHYNYLDTNENSHLKTNSSGEVIFRWFPDWDKHHFYADLETKDWVIDGDPQTTADMTVFKVKKAQLRKQITGQIKSSTSLGGFFIEMRSFQGERVRQSDMRSAFTDLEGRFTVDVLPDAHYAVYSEDSHWVSNLTDLVPYDSASNQVTPPQLEISAGQKVELVATIGPQKRPYANLSIHLRREHNYTWQEGNERKSGSGGPQSYVRTDESGAATFQTLPGKLHVTVYTPLWRTEKSVEVRSGEPITVELHRDSEEKRLVKGRVVLPTDAQQKLSDIEVRIGSVDGAYNDQDAVKCGADGQFSCHMFGSQLGIFAATPDGKLAGGVHVKDLDAPIELRLQRTSTFEGQLLTDGKPLIGHAVHAIIRIEGDRRGISAFSNCFDIRQIETRTDEQGNYTFSDVPCKIRVLVYTEPVDGSGNTVYLASDVRLAPNKVRPRTVTTLQTTRQEQPEQPLAERYRATLRDCAACGFHPIVIFYSGSGRPAEFANDNFVDHEKNGDVYGFMQIVRSGDNLTPADAAFAQEHGWRLPQPGHVSVYAFDRQGRQMAKLDVDVAAPDAAQAAAAFVKQHAPARVNAEEKWNEAFAEAKRSHRRVLARVSQRYCGPCFMLARWLSDQHELLGKDYVLLKIDDYRDEHGRVVAERLTHGNRHGIPFFAIFDEDGTLLVDSAAPSGNIGYPSSAEGKAHLRKMLLETRQNLAATDIDLLIVSIPD